MFADTGERRPVHRTGLGKVMLASRPRGEAKKVMAEDCARYTENTIAPVSAVEKELATIREAGYAADREVCGNQVVRSLPVAAQKKCNPRLTLGNLAR